MYILHRSRGRDIYADIDIDIHMDIDIDINIDSIKKITRNFDFRCFVVYLEQYFTTFFRTSGI